MLARKLGQMPTGSVQLLDVVSVSGQAVELGEAAAAAGLEEPDGALTQMRNSRLLRVVGEKVDTYHDRIRYAVLDRMPDGSRRNLHRRLAEVIERAGGGLRDQDLEAIADGKADPGGRASLARVYDLSYHYDAAGDNRRALAYALVAAAQARAQFALDVAAQQYALAGRNAAEASAEVRFRVARGRGEALLQLGRYEEAGSELRSAMALSARPNDTADVRGLLGELAYKVGATAESIAHFEDALRGLGIRVPRSPRGLGWGIVRESAVQLVHQLFPRRLHRGSPDPAADLANRLLGRLEYGYYNNNVVKLLWASLVGLNGAERLPPSPALAFNYVVHANDMSVFGWRRRATRYYQAAIDLSRELNDEWGAAQGLNHFAMGELQAGRYESALAKGEPGKADFTRLGDVFEIRPRLPRRGLQPLRPRQSGRGGGGGPSDLRIGGPGREQHVRHDRPAPLGEGHPRGTSHSTSWPDAPAPRPATTSAGRVCSSASRSGIGVTGARPRPSPPAKRPGRSAGVTPAS